MAREGKFTPLSALSPEERARYFRSLKIPVRLADGREHRAWLDVPFPNSRFEHGVVIGSTPENSYDKVRYVSNGIAEIVPYRRVPPDGKTIQVLTVTHDRDPEDIEVPGVQELNEEFPMGHIEDTDVNDNGELIPAKTALRELQEETGYELLRAGRLAPLGTKIDKTFGRVLIHMFAGEVPYLEEDPPLPPMKSGENITGRTWHTWRELISIAPSMPEPAINTVIPLAELYFLKTKLILLTDCIPDPDILEKYYPDLRI